MAEASVTVVGAGVTGSGNAGELAYFNSPVGITGIPGSVFTPATAVIALPGTITIASGGLRSNASVNDQWDNTTVQTVFQTAATYGPRYAMRTSQGTLSVPTATLNGNEIGRWQFMGHNGSAYVNGAIIIGVATQNWGVGATGAELVFEVTTTNTSILSTALALRSDLTAVFAGLISAAAGITLTAGTVLQLGNANSISAIAQTGFVTVKDSTGASIRLLTG